MIGRKRRPPSPLISIFEFLNGIWSNFTESKYSMFSTEFLFFPADRSTKFATGFWSAQSLFTSPLQPLPLNVIWWNLSGNKYETPSNRFGRLLLRTPGPVPFGTCICSNVETILSWTCHVYRPFEFRTSIGTSILLQTDLSTKMAIIASDWLTHFESSSAIAERILTKLNKKQVAQLVKSVISPFCQNRDMHIVEIVRTCSISSYTWKLNQK